jgi:formiminoglutamase
MSDAETFVRDSNAIIFDASALSLADMPAQKSESSSGLCTEEACMLLRFAGLHPGTKAVMFTGHDPISLQMNSSANTAAQMIWYFLEGYYQCIAEDPARSTHCTKYEVQLEGYEIGFTFYKSERTARWWVQVNTSSKHEPVFPCTFRDYQSAMNGHISQRLINCTNASLKSTQEIL